MHVYIYIYVICIYVKFVKFVPSLAGSRGIYIGYFFD